MIKVEELFIEPTATVLETLRKLDETGQRILFIAPEGQLKAVITDGDIRKFFLRGGTPDQTVDNAANYHPLSLPVSERGKARKMLQKHCIDALPILNKRGVITDIVFARGEDVDNRKRADIPVVMMAGGLGTRLYPYTKILPKPLIPVGEQPIAELIMDRFRDFGCHDFTMIVNYKRGMIKSYFGELEKDYTVNFADEDVFMGTGGGLCLLKGKMKSPFFFTNCDTLLDVDFGDIYEYHKAHGNLVTMVCAFKHYTVPYGVVELGEDGGIAAMREKPELDFLTNTGVYVVEPRVVEEMRDGEKIGFPDVIERYRAAGEKVGVYPISESSWMDMGQLEELEDAELKASLKDAGIGTAKKLALTAKECGADIVKYQTAVPELVVSKFAEKAEYQKQTTDAAESQLEMIRKLHFSFEGHKELKEYCDSIGIQYLSAPFDIPSVQFLGTLGLPLIKVPSGEITNLPYLEEVAKLHTPVLLSTGMSNLNEITDALGTLDDGGCPEVTVLHCNTQYPTPYEDANLTAMLELFDQFGLPVGLSDHTPGWECDVAAAVLGAQVIEKHFTLDKSLPGPDQKASLDPAEFKAMVDAVRHVEAALGDGHKHLTESEAPNKTVARKSIVAARAINAGEIFTTENLTTKRPGDGISPMRWYEVLGQAAKRDFAEDEKIEL